MIVGTGAGLTITTEKRAVGEGIHHRILTLISHRSLGEGVQPREIDILGLALNLTLLDVIVVVTTAEAITSTTRDPRNITREGIVTVKIVMTATGLQGITDLREKEINRQEKTRLLKMKLGMKRSKMKQVTVAAFD